MSENKIRVGITHGDLNGISYEIIIKALMDTRILDMCSVVVYGSKVAADFYRPKIKDVGRFNFNIIDSAKQLNPRRTNLIVCGDDSGLKIELGLPTAEAGRYAVAALERAVEDVKSGDIDLLVTCPINKFTTTGKDFNFIGHTEYLTAKFGENTSLMFMVSESLKVGLATMHMPLNEVSKRLTTEVIIEHLRLINNSMIRDFTVRAPKIAVLGLNPHSGDGGLLGSEEKDIIIPAINNARDEKILAFGPFAADGFFGSGNAKQYDAVLAMYHDQGLAPFKATSFADGVNYTAGLDVVRTSPAHGVGYDIAGKGVADPTPLRAAIFTALDIYRNRQIYKEITRNPLSSYVRNDRRNQKYDRDRNVEDMNFETDVE